MAAAAVATAIVSLAVVVVVVASCVGVVCKLSCKKSFNCGICISGCSAVKLDACVGKGSLCAAAYSSADKRINSECAEKPCKCSVAASESVDYLCVLFCRL